MLPLVGRGQVAITPGGAPVVQPFTGITSAMPTGWRIFSSASVRNVDAWTSAGTSIPNTAGPGTTISTGGVYNFGNGTSTSTTDRAVGGLTSTSGSKGTNVYVQLQNSSATTAISTFGISYNVNKYRLGSTMGGYSIQLYYSTNGTSWTSAGSNFLTSFPADATVGTAIPNPSPISSTPVSGQTLTLATPLAANGTLYLAWNYSVTTGTTTSNAQALGIDDVSIAANPPSITTLTPNTTTVGSSDFTMTLDGTGFQSGATAYFNGTALTTTFVSATQLTATVTAALVATVGTYPVVVKNSNGAASNAINFTVTAVAPANAVTTTAIPATTYCVGASGTAVSVPFTSSGTYSGNTYTAYIGSTSIGTLVSDQNSGTISATIPSSLASGSSYRIRVDASNPATTGSDNGANLTVVNYQTNNVTAFVATAGNAQVPLTWANPTACLTRTVVVASAAAITAVPNGSFTANAAFGSGTDLGGGQFVVYDGTGTGVTVTALTNGSPYFFKAFTTNGDGFSTGATATATPAAPVATLTASTSPATTPTSVSLATTSQGTPSAAKTYTLTGANLGTADVTVTAPAGFQVSTTSAFTGITTDANSLTLTPSSGSISQTVYVRLSGQVAGALSGTVVNTNGTLTANVLVSGTVATTATEPTLQPTVTVSNVGFTQADITLSGGNGQKRLVVLRTASASGFTAPADNATYTVSTVLGSGNLQGTGNYIMVADGTTTTATLTNLTQNVSYTVSVYAYNDDNVAGQENYLTTAPGTASLTTIPTPTVYYAKPTGDLNSLATYGFNTDGTGQSPPNFTATGKTYTVSGTNRTISGAWTVSGTGSKVVLASGASFTVPTTFAYTGTIDLQGTAVLTLLNATIPTLGSLAAGSTVDFAQTGTTTVPIVTNGYGNLKLTNGTKRFFGSNSATTDIYGNLTIENVANVGGASTTIFAYLNLFGDLSLLGTTTFDPSATRKLTLDLQGVTTQTVAGNGNTLSLFRLFVSNSATLSDANGGTIVELGNTSSNGGGIDIASGKTLAVNNNTVRFIAGGNAVISSGTGTFTLSPGSSLNLETANTNFSIGTLRLTPGATTLSNLRVSHTAGDYLDVTQSLTVTNSLVLDGQGILDIGANQTLTLNGTVSGTGNLRGSATSDVVIGGTGALGTLRFFNGTSTRQLRNLTLNRASGTLTLGSPLTVNGVFALTNGIISTSAANLLTLGSAATISGGNATSFVNGPLARVTTGPATTVFPIGKDAAYRPLTLNAAAQTSTTTYTGEIFNTSARTTGIDAPLTRVSNIRYATLTPNAQPSGFSGTLTMAFDVDDYVTDPQDNTLVMAKRNGSANWVSIGRTTANGSAATGNVAGDLTSDVFTSFSDFALASTAATVGNSLGSNPLPVELTAFSAQRQPDKAVSLKWNTASEKNSARFEVQRSLNGREYLQVASVAAQGASTQATAYAAFDKNAPAGRLYYRLRQVDLDGSSAYSPVVTVASADESTKVELYPNPAHSRISFIAAAATPYRVLSQLGQPLLRGTTEAGTASINIETLPIGLYFLELQTAAGRTVQKFEKQ
ncbi:T9SS type A sorting domain-containing protein [Hymenobacter agri]